MRKTDVKASLAAAEPQRQGTQWPFNLEATTTTKTYNNNNDNNNLNNDNNNNNKNL